MFDRRYLCVLLPSVSCSWNKPYYHIIITSQIRCRTRVNVEFGSSNGKQKKPRAEEPNDEEVQADERTRGI